jgi:ABC-2 type transport system permease protein
VIALVAGYGMLRLGLVPSAGDLTRLVVFFLVSVIYISLWLAIAILFSTLSRRSATTALATIALWLVMTFFAGLLSGAIADALHPTTSDSPPEAVLANARLDQSIHRISPDELYEEATQVLLDPAARTTSSLIEAQRLDQALPSSLSLDQSLSLAWWQVIGMLAVGAIIFVAAFVVFMRQEIRA